MPLNMTDPIHPHDCDRCQFLGTYNGYDMYICISVPDKKTGSYTLIARFDRDGCYASYEAYKGDIERTAFSYPLSDEENTYYYPLRIAYLIARDKGIVK